MKYSKLVYFSLFTIITLLSVIYTGNANAATDNSIDDAKKVYDKAVNDAKVAYDKVRKDQNATDQQKKDAQKKYNDALKKANDDFKKATDGTNKSSSIENKATNSTSSNTNSNSQIKDPIEKALADAKASYEKALADAKASYEKALADAKASYEKTLNEIKNIKTGTSDVPSTQSSKIFNDITKAKDPTAEYNKIASAAKIDYEKIRKNDNASRKQIDDAKIAYDKILAEAKAALKTALEKTK